MNTVGKVTLGAVTVAALAYFGATGYGWQLGGVGVSWSSDRQELERLTTQFLDDIRFKDFRKAATYHTASDQSAADIPALIESKFAVKPEQMDIQETRIERIDIAPDKQRAKAVTTCHVKLLNTAEIRDIEAVFYWRRGSDGRWYMQLKSSLDERR